MATHNSPALQGYMQDQHDHTGNGMSLEQRQFDIKCPELPTKSLNAYRTACVIRLHQIEIKPHCLKCATGKEIMLELNILPAQLTCSSYGCNNMASEGFKTCGVCRAASKAYSQSRRDDTPSGERFCKRCEVETVEKYFHYCDSCRLDIKRASGRKTKAKAAQKNARPELTESGDKGG